MMRVLTLGDEFRGIDAQTRRSVAISVGLHLILFAMLTLVHRMQPVVPVITEISWLEPEPAPEAAPPLARSEPVTAPSPPVRQFERRPEVAELEPKPQVPALSDQLQSRLADPEPPPVRPALLRAAQAPGSAVLPAAAPAPPPRVGVAPAALRREAAGGAPLALRRETPRSASRLLAEAAAPAPAAGLPEQADEPSAARALPGLSLAGPAADRPVREHPLPKYPEWAKQEAMEASVSLHFIVREDGRVRENVLVERTSGYADFDGSAVAAMRAWRFAPLPAGQTGEQWGTITFHFRLRDR